MFGMLGFYVSASGAIQVHHGPLVNESHADDDTLLLIPAFYSTETRVFWSGSVPTVNHATNLYSKTHLTNSKKVN